MLLHTLFEKRFFPKTWACVLCPLSGFFALGAVFFSLLAFFDPHVAVFEPQRRIPHEGSFIFLLCDGSSSMQEGARIEQLKLICRALFQTRESDLIAIFRFHKEASLIVPPTFDKDALERGLLRLTFADEGTAIGHAVQNAVTYAKERKKFFQGSFEKSIFILLTDGNEVSENSKPLRAAIAEAKEKMPAVFYSIYLGGGADKQALDALQKSCDGVFIPTSPSAVQDLIRAIDSHKKEVLYKEEHSMRESFLQAALLCMVLLALCHILGLEVLR